MFNCPNWRLLRHLIVEVYGLWHLLVSLGEPVQTLTSVRHVNADCIQKAVPKQNQHLKRKLKSVSMSRQEETKNRQRRPRAIGCSNSRNVLVWCQCGWNWLLDFYSLLGPSDPKSEKILSFVHPVRWKEVVHSERFQVLSQNFILGGKHEFNLPRWLMGPT